MKRMILFLLFFLFISPVLAQGDPSYINIDVVEGLDECDGGDAPAGKRCRIDGDLPNPTFVPGSDKAHCHEVETEVTNPITGEVSTIITIECVNQQTHIRQDNFIWSSHKDAGNYDLFKLHTMLEQARLPLTPALIWAVTTRNTNPQLDSWIARGCTYSRQTDQPTILEKNELSKQIMTLTDPYIHSIVEDLEYNKSIWVTAKTLDQYYQKASELVKPGTAYPCRYSRIATDVIRDIKDSGGKAEFTLLEIIKKTLLFILEETSGTFKVITETARKPFSEEMFGGMVQAKPEHFLNSRISQTRKDAISANAGIVETFRPCELEFEGPDINGEVLNEYEWESSGDTFDIKSRQHGMKLVDESTDYLQSTLLPVSLQEDRHKKPLNTKPCGGPTPPQSIAYDPNSGSPPVENSAVSASDSPGWNCNGGSGSGPSAGQQFADSGIFGATCDGANNAWGKCSGDVSQRSQAACVDPTFSLAIWLHESGASNYACSEAYSQQATGCRGDQCKTQDFGINIPAIAGDFSAQLNAFLSLPDYYGSMCPKTMDDFFSIYVLGKFKPETGTYACYSDISANPTEKKKIDDYKASIQSYYKTISGKDLPNSPKIANCSSNI